MLLIKPFGIFNISSNDAPPYALSFRPLATFQNLHPPDAPQCALWRHYKFASTWCFLMRPRRLFKIRIHLMLSIAPIWRLFKIRSSKQIFNFSLPIFIRELYALAPHSHFKSMRFDEQMLNTHQNSLSYNQHCLNIIRKATYSQPNSPYKSFTKRYLLRQSCVNNRISIVSKNSTIASDRFSQTCTLEALNIHAIKQSQRQSSRQHQHLPWPSQWYC